MAEPYLTASQFDRWRTALVRHLRLLGFRTFVASKSASLGSSSQGRAIPDLERERRTPVHLFLVLTSPILLQIAALKGLVCCLLQPLLHVLHLIDEALRSLLRRSYLCCLRGLLVLLR